MKQIFTKILKRNDLVDVQRVTANFWAPNAHSSPPPLPLLPKINVFELLSFCCWISFCFVCFLCFAIFITLMRGKKQNQTLSEGKKQSKILYWQLDFNVLHIFKKSEKPFIIKFKKLLFEFWTIWIKKKHKFQRSDLNHNETNLNQTNAQHLKPFSNSWDDH